MFINNLAASYNPTFQFEILWLIFSILIISFIVWLAIAIWVYKDAKKRGENGLLWLIIVLIGGLLGIVIWFLIRPPIGGKKSLPDRICPNCGRGIPFDANICPYCGKKFIK
jgi:hypothetical protein